VTQVESGDPQRRGYVVLRCRIGVRLPFDRDKETFEAALSGAIEHAAAEMGAVVDLLQLAAAIDPSWALAGPSNRL